MPSETAGRKRPGYLIVIYVVLGLLGFFLVTGGFWHLGVPAKRDRAEGRVDRRQRHHADAAGLEGAGHRATPRTWMHGSDGHPVRKDDGRRQGVRARRGEGVQSRRVAGRWHDGGMPGLARGRQRADVRPDVADLCRSCAAGAGAVWRIGAGPKKGRVRGHLRATAPSSSRCNGAASIDFPGMPR